MSEPQTEAGRAFVALPRAAMVGLDRRLWAVAIEREAAALAGPGVDRLPDAETLARWFHETYERLAPIYHYGTRPESAVPWEDVPTLNKGLMVATAREILARIG